MTVKPQDDFTNRAALCFICVKGKKIQREAINDLYADFYKSQFIENLYSATNPYDDFAESLAFLCR
ncbi:MAG: hypothetical protein U0T83_02550 [Bacteriovoracaceae bacterium]